MQTSMKSTRVKDLVDIVLLANHHTISRQRLADAIHEVFSSRDTHAISDRFADAPAGWNSTFRTLATTAALKRF